MATNPTIKPKRGTIAPGPGSISQNELAVNTVSQSVYIGSVSGSGILVGSAPQGSNTQVQFNSSGVFAGSSNFTFDGSGVNVNGIVSSGLGISTSATTFNIVTNTASTINIGTTSGSTISIGNASGTTTIRNAGTNLNGTLTVTGVSVHQGAGHFNSTLTVTSTSSLIGDVTASGDIAVNGGDITSTATTFNLLNATVTNANVLGASNTVVIGGTGGSTTIRNAGTNINGTLTVTGVSVHQGAGSFNSTLSVTGEATFVGSILANGGTITSSATTFNLLNTTVTNANVLGSANIIVLGGTGGTATIRNAGTNINGTLTVTGASTLQGAASLNSNLTVTGAATLQSTLAVGGNTISSASTTFNLLNTTVTNASVLGAADTVVIGSAGGSTTIRNAATRFNGTLTVTGVSVHQGAGAFNSTLSVTGTSTLIGDVTASGDIAVNGGDITSTATTFNLLNATVTNANVLGAANTVLLGGTGGTTTIRNAGTNINGTLTVTGVSVHQGAGAFNSTLSVTGASTLIGDVTASGDIAVNGGDITSTATTFNLLNATVTNANVLGAANTVVLGGTGGTTTIRNAGTNINGTLTVTGVSVHQGAGAFNSTLTVTGATVIQGALSTNGALSVTGTSSLIGDVTASGDIAVNGGDITSTATTFNLLNTTVTGLNLGGAANTVVIGGTGGTTTIRNAGTNINGTLTVTGATVVQGALSTNSTLSVTSNAIFVGSILANGGTITSTATTFNLLNTTVTNANVLGAATRVVIGANSSGDALIRNSNILLGGTVTGTTTISTTTGTAAHLTISPQGNLTLSPSGSFGAGGIRPSVTVPNNSAGTGTISISGAYVLIGNRNDGSDYSGEIRIQEQSGNDYFGLKAADTMAASTTYTLPSAFPASAGYVLQSTTTGLMSWAAPSSSAAVGVTATSASSNYKLVFTDVNATNTSASLLIDTTSGIVYNPSTDALIVNGPLSANSTLSVTGDATFAGSVIANGGTITSSATTFNLLNTTVTNANVLGAANTILIGSISGTTTIRNAGTNINGNLTVSGSSSFGAAVDHTFGLSNRGVLINAGKGTSEILSYGNETLSVSAIGGNGSLELFGAIVTVGDDGNNDGTQIIVDDDTGQTITYYASGGHIFSGVGSFDGLLTASAGISVSGATAAIFNGTVSCNSNTIYKPTLQYYNEVLASPAITANVLTLDLSTAQMFTVSLNANITTFTISNTPATANRSIGFTLIFTADGTARTVTWGAAVKWANNDPPALTSTNAKKDILSFVSPDGGTNWYGFIGGLNF